MKKILLILVSGLLITCMAGSAMADSIALVDPGSDAPVLEYAVGSTNYLNVKFSDFPSDTSYSYSIVNQPQIQKPGGTWVTATDDEVKVEFERASFIPTALDPTDDSVVKVTIGDASKVPVGSQITISASANSVNAPIITVTAVKRITTVPEFPTVAAPVAAVLGLLFVFGRKKGGL